MKRIIWTCWFQGRERAPPLVRKCLDSWREKNPDWEFHCLDAWSVERHVPIRDHLDLGRQSLTAASLSDVLRILLLQRFGGVWVDATLYCQQRLDGWLPPLAQGGFFAFAAPAADRPLASWFLYGEPDHPLVTRWQERTIGYWSGRADSDEYFWFHQQFRQMCETDPVAAAAWALVPTVSADGPHALQRGDRMYRPAATERDSIDWATPVFKLTHRLKPLAPGCLLEELLGLRLRNGLEDGLPAATSAWRTPPGVPLGPIAPSSLLPPH